MIFPTLTISLLTTTLLQSTANAIPTQSTQPISKPTCSPTGPSVIMGSLLDTISTFCDKNAGKVGYEPIGYLDTSKSISVQMTMLAQFRHEGACTPKQCKRAFHAIIQGCSDGKDDSMGLPLSTGGALTSDKIDFKLTLERPLKPLGTRTGVSFGQQP